jgi:subtilase family serine protease
LRRPTRSLAALGSAVAVTTSLTGAFGGIGVAAASALPAVHPFATRAPDSAFTGADPALGVACQRPEGGAASSTIHCYTPDDIRAANHLAPLTAATTDGAGQTIVLVDAYGSPTAAADLAHFASYFGGPAPDFETYFPLGAPDYKSATGNGSGTSGPSAAEGWAGEATLDIEWAYAIAPKAHIVLAATPPAETQGVQGLPNLMKAIDAAVAKYPAGTVFSMSFGTDESAFGGSSAARAQFARFDATFQRGLAKGDTFFASSGDDGSVGYARAHHQTATSPTPQVSYPNVSPYVTSVGGTQLQYGWTWDPTTDVPFTSTGSRNPAYFNWTSSGQNEQPVWNEGWASIGTGGGVSTVYPRPAYQDGVAGVVGGHRGVPDVAWNAAVNGGVLVFRSFFPSIDGPPSWQVYGGTSAASPQVAAMTAIGNAARAKAGKAPVGDLNSVLYAAQEKGTYDVVPHTYGTAASGNLHDNRMWDLAADGTLVPDPVPGYETTPGYDLTTGWGVPQGGSWTTLVNSKP